MGVYELDGISLQGEWDGAFVTKDLYGPFATKVDRFDGRSPAVIVPVTSAPDDVCGWPVSSSRVSSFSRLPCP